MAARLAETGADAIVSGQGGDAVFYQMPTAWVASEIVRRRGLRALGDGTLLQLARRMRTPLWSVYRDARAGLARGAILPAPSSSLLTPAARAAGQGLRHPWETAAAGLPLARQLQIAAIANMHIVRGDCARRRAGDLIFPLAAQPLVELCLSIPVHVLGGGAQDRAFARQALAGRLPELVRLRRSKGNLTSYFSRLVAASRETLLPYLRDGVLAEAGVLDRAVVEIALSPQQLIWSSSANEVLVAAATEAWVRHWQGRVPDAPRARRD
jgi:asparagine synthase (glutamine-hydrolysing)